MFPFSRQDQTSEGMTNTITDQPTWWGKVAQTARWAKARKPEETRKQLETTQHTHTHTHRKEKKGRERENKRCASRQKRTGKSEERQKGLHPSEHSCRCSQLIFSQLTCFMYASLCLAPPGNERQLTNRLSASGLWSGTLWEKPQLTWAVSCTYLQQTHKSALHLLKFHCFFFCLNLAMCRPPAKIEGGVRGLRKSMHRMRMCTWDQGLVFAGTKKKII